MSRKFLATLHYDGTGFVGWQRQPTGRSVQSEFEHVLERLLSTRSPAHAAGRTDAGVHASGLAVSFGATDKWEPDSLRRALNALLPRDCWVEAVREVPPGFHARKSAIGRRYRYDVGLDEAADSPFRRRFEWSLGRTLDRALLRAAAQCLPGRHDFRAFAVKGPPKPHYDCTIRHASWVDREHEHGVSFEVEADRFLHHMVRLLVGTMVDIGTGRRPVDDIDLLLQSGSNHLTSPPAPAHGLYFVGALYPEESLVPAPAGLPAVTYA